MARLTATPSPASSPRSHRRLRHLASGDHIDVAPGDFPRWSPDGRSILLTRDESIIAVDVDDGTEEVVTNGCCASIAPDGLQLVINRDT